MQVAIVGTGYVGLVTGTCLANFGLNVTCVDNDIEKIKQLNNGNIPIYEPNLEDLIIKNVKENRLRFTTDLKKAVEESQVIYIAVGTPPNHDGSANLQHVEEVAKDIGKYINEYKVIVNKCTVPVGTATKIKKIINKYQNLSLRATEGSAAISSSSPSPFDIISNPEFLREGSAVYDFTHPDKIVIGYESEKAKQIMQEIYRPLYLLDTPFVFTNLETAEMIKYACNAFLATKITFINEIANLCDRVGADVNQIAKAMGMDGRISPKFLHPGPGYGGSCFPKDTRALSAIANGYQYDFKLIKAVIEANYRQREIVVNKIEKYLGTLKDKTISILGLAFKQNTDDIRESAAIDIINLLLTKGATIRCFDPLAIENTKKILPDIIYCKDEYQTAKGSDALVILTEWNQFRNLDLLKIKKLLNKPIIFDMKNLYEPEKVKEIGFIYKGVGRR
jgi:UDPglucose 6-dehydrogenase